MNSIIKAPTQHSLTTMDAQMALHIITTNKLAVVRALVGNHGSRVVLSQREAAMFVFLLPKTFSSGHNEGFPCMPRDSRTHSAADTYIPHPHQSSVHVLI